MAYPTSAISFTTKAAGGTIQPADVNDIQTEVTAIEAALLTSGLAHDLKFVDASYDIGKSGATRPRDLFLSRALTVGTSATFGTTITVSGAGGAVNLPNITATTGTDLVLDVSNNVRTKTSAARFKARISPWHVSRAHLDQFVSLTPHLWDYVGEQNGAAGFLADDLAALPVSNAYGSSPLVNYDADGRPLSNRDFAVLALQHLVLQDHAARLAALEAAR